jgi:hypothetical protein
VSFVRLKWGITVPPDASARLPGFETLDVNDDDVLVRDVAGVNTLDLLSSILSIEELIDKSLSESAVERLVRSKPVSLMRPERLEGDLVGGGFELILLLRLNAALEDAVGRGGRVPLSNATEPAKPFDALR